MTTSSRLTGSVPILLLVTVPMTTTALSFSSKRTMSSVPRKFWRCAWAEGYSDQRIEQTDVSAVALIPHWASWPRLWSTRYVAEVDVPSHWQVKTVVTYRLCR